MSKTSKEDIESAIFLECKDDKEKLEKSYLLINKMNEDQLKELLNFIYISQVGTYQMILDYAEELEII